MEMNIRRACHPSPCPGCPADRFPAAAGFLLCCLLPDGNGPGFRLTRGAAALAQAATVCPAAEYLPVCLSVPSFMRAPPQAVPFKRGARTGCGRAARLAAAPAGSRDDSTPAERSGGAWQRHRQRTPAVLRSATSSLPPTRQPQAPGGQQQQGEALVPALRSRTKGPKRVCPKQGRPRPGR